MTYSDFINRYIGLSDKIVDKFLIILIVNVQNVTKNYIDYSGMSVKNEFYTYEQYTAMVNAVKSCGFEVKCYFDELKFITDFSTGVLRDNEPKKLLVINAAQKGTFSGRKSLIPAFCDMNNILYAGSDAYTASFFRDKYRWFLYFKHGKFPVCPGYAYHHKKGWIFGRHPRLGHRVIVKLNAETASVGLSDKSIQYFDSEYEEEIHNISERYNQEVIVQPFITGYEVETPVIVTEDEVCCFPPVGVSIEGERCVDERIIDYNIRKKRQFDYYDINEINKELSREIVNTSIDLIKNTYIRGFARIDYRIDEDTNIFVIDIATNPHITKHTAFFYHFKRLGYKYSDIIKVIIAVTAERFFN